MQNLQLERRGHLAFWLLGVITILLASGTAWTVLLFRSDTHAVEHSHEVLLAITDLEASVSQAESSVRAYFVAQDENELTVFTQKRAEAQNEANHLIDLVSDNPQQSRIARELCLTVSQRMAQLASAAREKKAGESQSAISSRHGNQARALIAKLTALTSSARSEEERLLTERRNRRRSTESIIFALCAIGGLGSIALVFAGQRAIRNYRLLRDQSQHELETVNSELDQRVRERTATIERANAELEHSQAELKELTGALQRSNVELESFAYSATHDLQEPLRTITVFAQLLLRPGNQGGEDERRKYLENILDSAIRMRNLIEGLMEYSRLSAEPASEALGLVDLNEALTVVEKNLSSQIQESGVVISRTPLPALRGNGFQLVRLMQNLIGNSIKYRSPDRPCKIHVAAERNGASWTVAVQDNGLGFKPEYREQIFALFKRLDRGVPGAGIGLAICQRVVERNGGRIWAEGAPDQGATFYFTWPSR